ncbi:hypothetical protein ACFFSY_22755 [Paenibacillus aurantiacus]|uniref:Butirosin biosynthesis protein H N-terminal domain-containing protein n=1 Tax=Paenibacillus aurantiacus TaxID=1936118 RepID=A0ABV5KVZ8_9BACL
MMKKELPFQDPPAWGLLRWAYTLGITSAYEQTYPWLMSNFIEVYANDFFLDERTEYFLDFYRGGGNEFNSNNPFLIACNMNYELAAALTGDRIVDYIVDCMDKGYYPTLFIDEYYIPSSHAYQAYSCPHHLLIYGYDRESRTFNTAGFGQTMAFERHITPFEDLELAYRAMRDKVMSKRQRDDHMYLFQFNSGCAYTFHLEVVRQQLENYYFSRTSHNLVNKNVARYSFGLNTYDSLWAYFEAERTNHPNLINRNGVRQLHIYMEHKQIMMDRLRYLHAEGYVTHPEELIADYAELHEQSFRMRNNLLKAFIRRKADDAIYGRIQEQLAGLKEREKGALGRLLEELHA